MPRSTARPRKGRSVLQKAQTRLLSQPKPELQPTEPEHSHSHAMPLDTRTYTPCNTVAKTVALVQMNKKIESLKKSFKNTSQRESRAKSKVIKLQKIVDFLCERLSDMCDARENAENALNHLQLQANASMQEVMALQEHTCQLKAQVTSGAQDVILASTALDELMVKAEGLEARYKAAHRARDALRKRISRINAQQNRFQSSPGHSESNNQYHLKDHARVIRPDVRDMLKKLACKGVSTKHASEIIKIVGQGLGVEVVGSVSGRSVSRIMFEGLSEARIQIAQEMKQVNYITICGDGTTIKNQQHEARSMYMRLPPSGNSAPDQQFVQSDTLPVLRTLGVHKAPNHTAKQQLSGWINIIDTCCDLLTRSPLGKGLHISSKMVAPKLRGVLTDHAADQKRFHELLAQWKQSCDREVRAVSKLKTMSVEEQLHALSDHLENAANSIKDWRAVPADQQAALMHDAWFALAAQIGEAEFQLLTPEVQFDVDFLAWNGCCMHKELNAVKGGVSKMSAAWKLLSLTPPIALKNKFEAAKASRSMEDKSTRGAIKLASLAGALFNNKDDKKGYQHTIDYFFEVKKTFGYSNRFPDTSNTRYGSYCNAAAELLLHRETYLKLLELLHDAKCVPGFTNIEHNISQGLQDVSTLTELAVLAIYAQSIGSPYMRQVRSTTTSALSLGPLHKQVKQHCRAILENPDLLLGADASAMTGALDDQPWDRPEVVYCILSLIPSLPNIRSMLVAFFDGALQTWERFTSEFDEDGTIARATSMQRESAWVPPTNDVSEGALGQCRQMLRRAPTMSDEQRNARVMWQRNNTYEWAKQTLTDEDRKFIRREARNLDASGSRRAVREELNGALEERAANTRIRRNKAAARRSANSKRLAEVELLEGATYDSLISLKVVELDRQIDKLREVVGSEHIRAKTMIGNKSAKIKEILAGLEHLKQSKEGYPHEKIASSSFDSDNVKIDVDSEGESSSEDAEMCFNDEIIY